MTVQVHRSPSRIITTENTTASDNDRADELTAILERESHLERVARAIVEKMSPEGALKLPPLLEKRRLEFGIPDEAFKYQATFETILFWQLHLEHEESSVTPGGIHKPETRHRGELQQSPRGIVVSAGLAALDVLRANGSGLGHIVNIMRQAPYRRAIANYAGLDVWIYSCNVGQIFADEDVGGEIFDGKKAIVYSDKFKQHTFVNTETKEEMAPASPKVDPGEWD